MDEIPFQTMLPFKYGTILILAKQKTYIINDIKASLAKYPPYNNIDKLWSQKSGTTKEIACVHAHYREMKKMLQKFKENNFTPLSCVNVSWLLAKIKQQGWNLAQFTNWSDCNPISCHESIVEAAGVSIKTISLVLP